MPEETRDTSAEQTAVSRARVLDDVPDTLHHLVRDAVGVCTRAHLQHCRCQQELIEKCFRELQRETHKELKEKGLLHNDNLVENRKKIDEKRAITVAARVCEHNEIMCPHAVDAVLDEIKHFDKNQGGRYDLGDPRVRVILISLLDQRLVLAELRTVVKGRGVVETVYDKHGNPHDVVSAIAQETRKFTQARVKAIETLDKIIEGQKHQMLSHETVTPEELFGSIETTARVVEEVDEID